MQAIHSLTKNLLRRTRSGTGKKNVRTACSKDKLEFKFFSSPGVYSVSRIRTYDFIFYYLQIVKIENLAHLTELRVLNLAGNEIVNVCNVSGMKALAELNLRRNKISTVVRMYFLKFLSC